jgi:hypothetical protein
MVEAGDRDVEVFGGSLAEGVVWYLGGTDGTLAGHTEPLPTSLPLRNQLVTTAGPLGCVPVGSARYWGMPNAARAAKNEGLFRAVNERILEIEEDFGKWQADDQLTAFICECSRLDCMSKVDMSFEEYQAVRAKPAQFLILPGHFDRDHERIVKTTNDRFTIIEKFGLAGEIATEQAP